MGMDWCRAAKKSQFILYGDSNLVVPVRWYRCLDGAKPFPFEHVFGNADWYDGEPSNSPGDINFVPRVFDLGVEPALLFGQFFCGPLAYYQGKARLADNPPPLHLTSEGQPDCCLPEAGVCLSFQGADPTKLIPCPSLLYPQGQPEFVGKVNYVPVPMNWVPDLPGWDSDTFGNNGLPFRARVDWQSLELLIQCRATATKLRIPVKSLTQPGPLNPDMTWEYTGPLDAFCCLKVGSLLIRLANLNLAPPKPFEPTCERTCCPGLMPNDLCVRLTLPDGVGVRNFNLKYVGGYEWAAERQTLGHTYNLRMRCIKSVQVDGAAPFDPKYPSSPGSINGWAFRIRVDGAVNDDWYFLGLPGGQDVASNCPPDFSPYALCVPSAFKHPGTYAGLCKKMGPMVLLGESQTTPPRMLAVMYLSGRGLRYGPPPYWPLSKYGTGKTPPGGSVGTILKSGSGDYVPGVQTECCPEPIPHTVHITFGPDSPPSAFDGQTVALWTYGPGFPWESPTLPGEAGEAWLVAFGCDPAKGGWDMFVQCVGFDFAWDTRTQACGPLRGVFHFPAPSGSATFPYPFTVHFRL
jgi:hypothetical protein